MKVRWIKLRLTGEIEKTVTDRDVPSVGDGVYLDEIGYEVKVWAQILSIPLSSAKNDFFENCKRRF